VTNISFVIPACHWQASPDAESVSIILGFTVAITQLEFGSTIKYYWLQKKLINLDKLKCDG